MKAARYYLHRYATPNHVKAILALLTLITFVVAGGAPGDDSGGG